MNMRGMKGFGESTSSAVAERSLETTGEREVKVQENADVIETALESLEENWSETGVVFQSWWSSTEDSTRIGLLQVSFLGRCTSPLFSRSWHKLINDV